MTMTITTSTPPPAAAVVTKFEPSAKHQAAILGLSEEERDLVLEAISVNLDYVKNELYRKPTAERELFDEGLPIQPASTGWYHPMVEDELIGQSAPSSSVEGSTAPKNRVSFESQVGPVTVNVSCGADAWSSRELQSG